MQPVEQRSAPPAPPEMQPDKYLVVERMDAVKMHFVFVYSDDTAAAAAAGMGGAHAASPLLQPAHHGQAAQMHAAAPHPQQGHSSLLLWLLAGFTLLLLFVGLRDNSWPQVRRMLRRSLGLPLY